MSVVGDVDQPTNISKNPLHVLNGLMTWSKTKALNGLVLKVSTKSDLKGSLEHQKEAQYIIFMCKRSPIQPYLGYEVRRKHGKRRKHSKENKRIQADLGHKMVARLSNYTRRLFQQL